MGVVLLCGIGLVFVAIAGALPALLVWRLTRWARRSSAFARIAAAEGSRWEKLAWPFVQSGPIALPLFASDDGQGRFHARNLVIAADGSATLDYEKWWSRWRGTSGGRMPTELFGSGQISDRATYRWYTTVAVFRAPHPLAAFQLDPQPGWHAQGGGEWLILFGDRQIEPSAFDTFRANAKAIAESLLASR